MNRPAARWGLAVFAVTVLATTAPTAPTITASRPASATAPFVAAGATRPVKARPHTIARPHPLTAVADAPSAAPTVASTAHTTFASRADLPALALVDQDHVTVAPGATVAFTVAVPAEVTAALTANPASAPAEIDVVAAAPIDSPAAANGQTDTRQRLADAVAGKLPVAFSSTSIPLAGLVSPAAGQVTVPVVVDGTPTAANGVDNSLRLGVPGIYPLTIELRSGGVQLARVITFVQRDVAGDATPAAPLAVALAVGTDAPVVLDDTGAVSIDAATIAQLTTLVQILETSAVPATVRIAPQLLSSLRRIDSALADRFAAVLDTAMILSAPVLPLDPSAAAAANQRDLYTQWLADGEDLFGSADLSGTTLRAATAVSASLSEPGGELLRDLGTRLLLLTPSLYDGLDGSLRGFTDTSQLVQVRLDDDRTFDAAIVDPRIGARLEQPSPTPFLAAIDTVVDLLADRHDIIGRGGNPRRHTVLIGTDGLGLPDPATLAQITKLISTTPGLAVSTVSQISATTDTLLNDGEEVTVNLPATTPADISARISMQTSLRASGAQAASMLTDSDPRPAAWQTVLDSLPSSAVTDARATQISDTLQAEYAAIRSAVQPPPGLDFTLTGRTGTIRLKFHNSADFPINVIVRLGAASNKLIFPPEHPHTLAPDADTEIKIQIQARSNGRFPVYLTVLAPLDAAGTNPLAPVRRFTATVAALSGLGNLVTGAALLVLLSWWLRHVRIGRRRKATSAARGRHPVTAPTAGPGGLAAGPAGTTLRDQ